MSSARRVAAAVCAVALTSVLAGPLADLAGPAAPAAAQTIGNGTATGPTLPVVATTTTTTTPPRTTPPPSTTPTTRAAPPTPTTARPAPAKPSTPTTTKPAGRVPAVPTGGPPTTTAPPGAPPPPPPDPTPILTQVDDDLARLTAIDDYKPAQALVADAQAQVTTAGAALQSARQNLTAAQHAASRASAAKATADAKLRSMALAAYIGVGYSTPGFGAPGGNGDQGAGTVSTPGGLTGIKELDAKEMLILVGEHARQSYDDAKVNLVDAQKAAARSAASYHRAQTGVSQAESALLAAQQTLRQVITAATNPGAAAVTPLPNLASLSLNSLSRSAAVTTTTVPRQAVDAGAAGPAPPGGVYSPNILGPSALTGPDLAAWFASTGHQANTTVPIAQLAQDYQTWGQKTGVRYDVAFAQSVVETGFFSFPAGGQLTSKDNNFAGIGACDSCAHGWSFPDASAGVGAQLQLLDAYASPTKVDTSLVGSVGVGGCCSTWMALSGVWASSTVYGISIMTIYHQMLSWLIPRRLVAAGLVASPAQATQGPELAPLPGAPKNPKAPATKAAGVRAAATKNGK